MISGYCLKRWQEKLVKIICEKNLDKCAWVNAVLKMIQKKYYYYQGSMNRPGDFAVEKFQLLC